MRAHSCAVLPVSEPAAFEEDVAAANRLYLTRLCAPVKGREGEDDIKKRKFVVVYRESFACGVVGERLAEEEGVLLGEGSIRLKVNDRGATFAFSTVAAEMLPEETSCSPPLGSVCV